MNQATRMRYRTLIDTLRSRIVQEINRFTFEIDKIKQLSKRQADFTVNLDAFNETYLALLAQVKECKELDPAPGSPYREESELLKSNKSYDNIKIAKKNKSNNFNNNIDKSNFDKKNSRE
jgi:hypothetical protein